LPIVFMRNRILFLLRMCLPFLSSPYLSEIINFCIRHRFIFSLKKSAPAENMCVQISLQPPHSHVGKTPGSNTSCEHSHAIPVIRELPGKYTYNSRNNDKDQTGNSTSGQIIEILQEQNNCIHEKEDKIPGCQAWIDCHHKSCHPHP